MKLWWHNTMELWTVVGIVLVVAGLVKLGLWIAGVI